MTTEHPRARLARLFNLSIAFDRRGLHRPQFLAPGMKPDIEGPWTIYGFKRDATGTSKASISPSSD
jgi:hypothetical protein